MSEITYISEELVMEGNLDSAGSSVVVAGRFKGELRAKDVLLEANSIFDGNLIADKVTLGGLVKGEVAANTLNVASSAKVEGNLNLSREKKHSRRNDYYHRGESNLNKSKSTVAIGQGLVRSQVR